MKKFDSIKRKEWLQVKELAANIVNGKKGARKELKVYLKSLMKKHGRATRLVATLADFERSRDTALALYKEAYVSACERSDSTNKIIISADIAEHYLDQGADISIIDFWVSTLKINIQESESQEHSALLKSVTTSREKLRITT